MAEVKQFAALARSGSYLAGDRRVSPRERSPWWHTFRRLGEEAQDALRGADIETAGVAGHGVPAEGDLVERIAAPDRGRLI